MDGKNEVKGVETGKKLKTIPFGATQARRKTLEGPTGPNQTIDNNPRSDRKTQRGKTPSNLLTGRLGKITTSLSPWTGPQHEAEEISRDRTRVAGHLKK